jgi:hypothetical protein
LEARLRPAYGKSYFVSGYPEESLHPEDRREVEMQFLPKTIRSGATREQKVREVLDGAK